MLNEQSWDSVKSSVHFFIVYKMGIYMNELYPDTPYVTGKGVKF